MSILRLKIHQPAGLAPPPVDAHAAVPSMPHTRGPSDPRVPPPFEPPSGRPLAPRVPPPFKPPVARPLDPRVPPPFEPPKASSLTPDEPAPPPPAKPAAPPRSWLRTTWDFVGQNFTRAIDRTIAFAGLAALVPRLAASPIAAVPASAGGALLLKGIAGTSTVLQGFANVSVGAAQVVALATALPGVTLLAVCWLGVKTLRHGIAETRASVEMGAKWVKEAYMSDTLRPARELLENTVSLIRKTTRVTFGLLSGAVAAAGRVVDFIEDLPGYVRTAARRVFRRLQEFLGAVARLFEAIRAGLLAAFRLVTWPIRALHAYFRRPVESERYMV